jgi:hypothetical protein
MPRKLGEDNICSLAMHEKCGRVRQVQIRGGKRNLAMQTHSRLLDSGFGHHDGLMGLWDLGEAG